MLSAWRDWRDWRDWRAGDWRLTWGELGAGQWLPLKPPRQLPLSTERDGRGLSLEPAVARRESGII